MAILFIPVFYLDDAEYIVCTNDGDITQKIVPFTDCKSTSDSFNRAMDKDEGVFVAPEDGAYEVSFTGHLKSFGGNRVWATLYKLDIGDTGG